MKKHKQYWTFAIETVFSKHKDKYSAIAEANRLESVTDLKLDVVEVTFITREKR